MINKDLCEGCLNCVLACMAEHGLENKSIEELDLENTESESRNHIEIDMHEKKTPIFCRHCDNPECVNTCTTGAMTKDPETGIVSYNRDKCASCFMCVMSCPYGVLKPGGKDKKSIIKCDLCGGRETPRCIENCPTGAIYIEEV